MAKKYDIEQLKKSIIDLVNEKFSDKELIKSINFKCKNKNTNVNLYTPLLERNKDHLIELIDTIEDKHDLESVFRNFGIEIAHKRLIYSMESKSIAVKAIDVLIDLVNLIKYEFYE
jgi:hypothetical protein